MPDAPVPTTRRRMLGRIVPALLLLPLAGKPQILQAAENLSADSETSPSGARISITPPTLSVPRRG